MKYLSYLIGGAVCAGGSACAVVVPVSLNSSGKIPRPLFSKCAQGSSGAESVTFGDAGTERVCWKLKSEDSDQEESVTTSDNASESPLTSLLQEIWGNREDLSSRAELNGAWKSNCTEGKWMLSSTSQGGSVGLLQGRDRRREFVSICRVH
ncbi:hypothetical protein [Candidatus Mycoplasma haematominutum]|uniref:Lipoprotein n=1 Tax=Candidatus Mycoplasma haematominutum 'Birmingham 1' TaxID=1116213 RepID=G8C3R7_9MOLU|nr:hypothetical protein [Candidatus Mycoplasma haematominutum]CCE66965.1 hypothetical protein MHM_04470 [Candidatus Mycoplasma haematominutum 'Birmingham 1']